METSQALNLDDRFARRPASQVGFECCTTANDCFVQMPLKESCVETGLDEDGPVIGGLLRRDWS